MTSRADRDRMWAEAQRRCRLSWEALSMAKELGLATQRSAVRIRLTSTESHLCTLGIGLRLSD